MSELIARIHPVHMMNIAHCQAAIHRPLFQANKLEPHCVLNLYMY